uniref:Uncharacterized protein n=1 Tax=Salix viminalis TaxID=40686 RepID=A0A6N2L8N5_SALVM
MQFDELQLQPQQAPTESTGFCDASENGIDNEDLHELARAFVSRCLPGVYMGSPRDPSRSYNP